MGYHRKNGGSPFGDHLMAEVRDEDDKARGGGVGDEVPSKS